MVFRTDKIKLNDLLGVIVLILLSPVSYAAQDLGCEANAHQSEKLCGKHFTSLRHKSYNNFLTAYLISDAPSRLLVDTQLVWQTRIGQCLTSECIHQQFNLREDELNLYTSLNQSLTRHYLKFEQGQVAKTPVHLQVHQLNKNKIKIEAQAFQSLQSTAKPHMKSMLAYTTPDKKNQILDTEHHCEYQLNFQKSILTIQTSQKGCGDFAGIYRLYD